MIEQNTPKMSHDEMIDTLKGLVFDTFDRTTAKERDALGMAIEALEQEPRWIPVSERLPLFRLYKVSDDVLITNGYEIDMGYLVERKGKIFWHYYGGDIEVGIKDEDNDAIAWMPLPETYKAESDGKNNADSN